MTPETRLTLFQARNRMLCGHAMYFTFLDSRTRYVYALAPGGHVSGWKDGRSTGTQPMIQYDTSKSWGLCDDI